MRLRKSFTSSAILMLLISSSASVWTQAAWSQAIDENDSTSSNLGRPNISERFEAGEFGEPQDAVRPESAQVMASLRDPTEAYVYYVVPCDTPGAIRAGSPAALLPESEGANIEGAIGGGDPAPNVCVVLVDESRTDGAPLLYSYDSSYRYPAGYPSHHRPNQYSRTYGGSASVGVYNSRRYGRSRYGRYGGYNRYGYGTGYNGPYPDGPNASTPYSHNAGPNGPYPYGSGRYGSYGHSPYGYGGSPYGYGGSPYGYGGSPYGASYFGVSHFGVGHFGGYRFGSRGYRGRRFNGNSYAVPNGRMNRGRTNRRANGTPPRNRRARN
jgi:hypothetical protein